MGTYIERFKGRVEVEKGRDEPTIAVSGFSGTGKSTFARVIAEELNLEHIKPGEIFRKLAKEESIPLEEYSKKRKDEIDLKVDKRMLRKAKEGGYVLDGRLTAWVAGDYADLKVYLKTDPKIAAGRVAERESLSKEEAYERIKTRDKADKKKYGKLYNIDFDDLTMFDFVINNDKLEISELRQFGRLIASIFSK